MNIPLTILTTIAWRNVWRNHRRTLVMLAAIAVGVWSMVWLTAIMRGMVDQMIKDSIENFTGHIQIHAHGYRDDPAIENSMPEPSDTLIIALSDSRIKKWSTRVKVPGVITSERESMGVTIVGIDPQAERDMLFLEKDIAEGRNLDSADDKGIVIGKKLAERLETKLGRRVVLMSQDPDNNIVDRGFRVIGIFDTGMEATETGYVFIGRNYAQQILKMAAGVSELALITADYRNLGDLVAKISTAADTLEVLPWDKVDPYTGTMLGVIDGFVLVWFVVVFVAMSFGLLNTLLMAVFERTREIGLIQALGMKPNFILLQVLIESFFLLTIGLLLGNLLAWMTLIPIADGWDISGLGTEGLEYAGMSSILYPVVLTADVVTSNVVVVVLGLIASLYPAWRAARYVPVEAITRM
jgi:ABC-type lipoprotein release transport system permease subunit